MEKVGKAIDSYSENTLLDKGFYFEIALSAFFSRDMKAAYLEVLEAKFKQLGLT